MLTLNKEYSGFTKNLYIDIFKENWNVSSDFNINKLLQLYNINKISDIKKEYNSLIDNLNLNETNINYKFLLGNKEYSNRVNNIKKILNLLKSTNYKSYTEIIEKRIQFTTNFSPLLYKDDLIYPGEYDHFSSQTGRVKLKGCDINFLTMKNKDKVNLSSTYVKGKIYSIDIVSLEPRVYLHINKKEPKADVYSYIKNHLNIKADRNKIKIAIISSIYGGGYSTIKKISGLKDNDITKILKYFDTTSFKEILVNKGNNITNYYNRPLRQNQAILNHFIQSTSADCAILSFYKLMNRWSDRKIKFNAFIHDAIIVDVHPDEFETVNNLQFISEDILNIDLPVKVEIISEEKN
jgi:hypothetical protein